MRSNYEAANDDVQCVAILKQQMTVANDDVQCMAIMKQQMTVHIRGNSNDDLHNDEAATTLLSDENDINRRDIDNGNVDDERRTAMTIKNAWQR